MYFRFYILGLFFIVCLGCKQGDNKRKNGKVFIQNNGNRYLLYRNKQPFHIRGAAGTTYLSRLKALGGNTIRTYDTTDLKNILDSAYYHDIAVIVSFPMLRSGYWEYFYKDTAKVAGQYRAFKNIVQRIRSHPALLMWCMGNELDFPYSPRYKHYYTVFKNILRMIHEEDPDHPVTTPLMNFDEKAIFNIRTKIPELDIISFNLFGQIKTFKSELKKWKWLWDGPYLISEWGINGPWETDSTAWGAPLENTSIKKEEQLSEIYEHSIPHEDPRFLGAFIFFWGQKQETTHTWFSFFSKEGKPVLPLNFLKKSWGVSLNSEYFPDIKYMLINGKGAHENLFFPPSGNATAELMMHSYNDCCASIKWELLPEDWYETTRKNAQKPTPIFVKRVEGDSLVFKLNFRMPAEEGPYRLFVEVTNDQGKTSTANAPFYILLN